MKRNLTTRLSALFALLTASTLAGQTAAPASSTEEIKTLSVFTVAGDKDEGYRSTQTISGSSYIMKIELK